MNMCATGIDVAPVSIVFYYILEVLRQCSSLFFIFIVYSIIAINNSVKKEA
jgi:hypothetical protein